MIYIRHLHFVSVFKVLSKGSDEFLGGDILNVDFVAFVDDGKLDLQSKSQSYLHS